jgi:hypothetical protein
MGDDDQGSSVSAVKVALGSALAWLVRWSGIAFIVRHTIARRRASIVLLHDPEPAALDDLLRYLARRYRPIPVERLVAALRDGGWSSLPRRTVVVTLDDGRAGNAALGDVLAAHGVRPTIFLISRPVNDRKPARWPTLDRAAIARLGDRCDFGSHTRTHAFLLKSDDRDGEIAGSRAEVEALTGRPCEDFAYPGGAYEDDVVRRVREAGYRSARTVDVGWVGPGTDPYRLPILSMDPRSPTHLAAELSGLKWLSRLIDGKGDLRGRRRFGPARGAAAGSPKP